MSHKIEPTDDSLNINTNFTHNLQYLMQKNKLTAVDLAVNIGVSAELIGKLKNGSLSNPTLKVLAGISKYFNLSLQDLVFKRIGHIIYNPRFNLVKHIPVVEWNNILNWQEIEPVTYLVSDKIYNDDTLALFLDHDYGPFPEGAYVFVDPQLVPKNNDYVLVLKKEDNQLHIKKLLIEEDSYLQSIIPQINNVIEYNEKHYLIYGVIRGYQKSKFFRG